MSESEFRFFVTAMATVLVVAFVCTAFEKAAAVYERTHVCLERPSLPRREPARSAAGDQNSSKATNAPEEAGR